MKYIKYEKNRFFKVFAFLIIFAVCFSVLGFAFANKTKIKAETNYYEDIRQYVYNDWENYTDIDSGDIHLTNNGDGTFTCYGSTTTVRDIVLPLKPLSTRNNYYYTYYIALAVNNSISTSYTYMRLYPAYNNGNNFLNANTYCVGGGSYNSRNNMIGEHSDYALVLRFDTTTNIQTPIILTPFFYIREYNATGISPTGQQLIDLNTINMALGPNGDPPIPDDLTKCVYVDPNDLPPTARMVGTKIGYRFNIDLDNLIEFTFQAEDVPTVDNTGVVASYIDLLSFSDADSNTYIMRFDNDANSATYLNIDLYTNAESINFYNDNLGELSAQNIINFRAWCTKIINAQATILSASAYDNDIISQIYVYQLGSSYNEGYQAGEEAGYQAGALDGFGEGLQQGYQDGYTTGYGEGYDIGVVDSVDSSWLINLFGAVDTFFSIHLLPNLTFGTLFAIPFVLSIAWVIIRILRGGGYGD